MKKSGPAHRARLLLSRLRRADWKRAAATAPPYLLAFWLFNRLGSVYQATGGAWPDRLLETLLRAGEAFSHPLPSLCPTALLAGLLGAAGLRLLLFLKGRNPKKYRRGEEYGSARWSA